LFGHHHRKRGTANRPSVTVEEIVDDDTALDTTSNQRADQQLLTFVRETQSEYNNLESRVQLAISNGIDKDQAATQFGASTYNISIRIEAATAGLLQAMEGAADMSIDECNHMNQAACSLSEVLARVHTQEWFGALSPPGQLKLLPSPDNMQDIGGTIRSLSEARTASSVPTIHMNPAQSGALAITARQAPSHTVSEPRSVSPAPRGTLAVTARQTPSTSPTSCAQVSVPVVVNADEEPAANSYTVSEPRSVSPAPRSASAFEDRRSGQIHRQSQSGVPAIAGRRATRSTSPPAVANHPTGSALAITDRDASPDPAPDFQRARTL
jgi:hypothetical protein